MIVVISKELHFDHSMFETLFGKVKKDFFNKYFLIVTERTLSSSHEVLLKEMYWHDNVLNVVIVAMEDGNYDPSVITYHPFKNATIRITGRSYKRTELFIDKNSNIYGAPIKVIMYKDTLSSALTPDGGKPINFNFEQFLPDFITTSMNATLVLTTPLTKDFDTEEVKSADLIINGRSFLIQTLHEIGMEETIPMRRDDICVFLPYDRSEDTFDDIIRTLHPFVWAMLVVAILGTWTSLTVINKLISRRKIWNQMIFCNLLGMQMSQAMPNIPKSSAFRLIIASWLTYCLIIDSAFQGSLYNVLANRQDTKITKIDELLNLNQSEILVSDILYNYSGPFLDGSPIAGRFTVVSFQEFLNRVLSNQPHQAFVARSRGAQFFETVQIVDGLPVYYTLEQSIVPLMAYYFCGHGARFLNRVNYLLRLAEEVGMFEYWEEEVTNVYDKLKRRQRLFNRHSPRNLHALFFVFELWIFGLLSAVLVLMVELGISKFKNRNREIKSNLFNSFHTVSRRIQFQY